MRAQGAPISFDRVAPIVRMRHERVPRADTTRSGGLMMFVQDLRYALRSLGRSRAFTAAAVLTLTLGIGANTAMFSVIDPLMLRPLPVRDPEQLRLLLGAEPGQRPAGGFTNAVWEAIRDQQHVFASVFAWSGAQTFDLAEGGTTRPIDGDMVSGGYFAALGVGAAAGRLFNAADDHRDCTPVAVLSYAFWQSYFGGASGAIGGRLTLNRQPFEIIGVAPARFRGLEVGRKFDVAVPICASALFDRRNVGSRNRWWLNIGARVAAASPPEKVQAALDALSPSVMSAAVPNGDAAGQKRFLATRLVTVPAATGDSALRRTFGEPLRLLMAGVAIVLLIACSNIAGLMLARGRARAREIAVRAALGASRRRLVRHLLTEALVVATIGATFGALLGRWTAALLFTSLSTGRSPVFIDVSLDARVLAFTVSITALTAMLIGVVPAFRSTRVSLMSAMKGIPAGAPERRPRVHAGAWMVMAQVALTLVLLTGGGLLVRTFVNLTRLDAGFDRHDLLVVTARAPWFAADTVKLSPEERTAVFEAITRRIESLPGVVAVARAFTTPIGDDNWVTRVNVESRDGDSGPTSRTYLNRVTPRYFSTLRTPFLAGRDFDITDTATSERVAIVNRTFASRFFDGGNALGRRFTIGNSAESAPNRIVGIVKDSKYETLREAVPATAFLPATQPPRGSEAQEFVVRTSSSAAALIPTVQRAIGEITHELPLRFQTLDEQVADSIAQERLVAMIAAFFGLLALLLAAVGVYGLLNYLVTQQRLEFGVRLALGAAPGSILRLVLRNVSIVLAAGTALGLAGSLFTLKLLNRIVFGLEPHDAPTIVAAVCVLAAATLVAGYLPARRAASVDPTITLRSE
jgi:predicted permease